MNAPDSMFGHFEGSGHWYDSAGKDMAYRVVQDNSPRTNGVEFKFKHDFDDGTKTDAQFLANWTTPVIFQLQVAEKNIGQGYCFADTCHYGMRVGEAFIEVSYRLTEDGLEVNGSSTRNADGNFIAWHELLRRDPDRAR